MLPLYEAKMIHLYDTRWATYEPDGSTRLMTEAEKADRVASMPRYWVAERDAERAWGSRKPSGAYFAWRGIARSSDLRTAIGTVMPSVVPAGGNFDMVLGVRRQQLGGFAGAFSSFAFDFVARQKLTNMHLQFTVAKQLPIPTPSQLGSASIPFDRPVLSWIDLHVDRLSGWVPEEVTRSRLRSELDALMFHLYGLDRDELSHVMDTFLIVKRKDEAAFGSYRTKALILDAYDAMSRARASGTVYRSPWAEEVRT